MSICIILNFLNHYTIYTSLTEQDFLGANQDAKVNIRSNFTIKYIFMHSFRSNYMRLLHHQILILELTKFKIKIYLWL